MHVDINLAKQAIYWRGLFINRYCGIEFAVAELVSRAWLHRTYNDLGPPPFGPTKKIARLRRVIKIAGPIAAYRDEIEPCLTKFAEHEEHRHFMAHGLMVPRSTNDILFRMYDHREGVYSVGILEFELAHLKQLAELIGEISADFTNLVARICKEIPLPEA